MSKPSFKSIFPSKKLINRILFQMDSDVTSRTIVPIYESIYCEQKIPTKYANNGEVLFLMNRVLQQVKKLSNFESTQLKPMRNFLLYSAAKEGSNDAISLLCYDILSDKLETDITENSEVLLKKKESEKLLKDLVLMGHGLSFKVVGDLYYSMGQVQECKRWYLKFLEQPNLKNEIRGEILERLGEIEFKENINNIKSAEARFLEAITLCKLQDCVKSYFYLAQIYIKYDPLKSKVLLEQCCSQGFKEAFKEIGYLEMNYFRDLPKAQEWFKIGMEIFDIESFFGYFDCSFQMKEYKSCLNCLKSMENLAKMDVNSKDLMKVFVTQRADKIQTVMKHAEGKPSVIESNKSVQSGRNSNWNI